MATTGAPVQVGGGQAAVVLETAGGQNHPPADDVVPHPHAHHGGPVENDARDPGSGADLDAGVAHAGQQGTDEGPAPDRSPEHDAVVVGALR